MSLPELCIRRPVMTTLLTAALGFFGVLAYLGLPVSDLPVIDYPNIQVSASLPGATPETMASSVAKILEQQLSTIAGVEMMSSTSGTGTTQIALTFTLDRDIDAAAQDVQAALAAVQRRLPTDMPSPPTFRKTNPNEQAVLFLTLSSATLPLTVVNEYADTKFAQRLSSVDGVAQVNVFGAQKFALRVRLDPRLLASRGITLGEVRDAIARANVSQPTGYIDGARQSVQILANGQLEAAHEFRDIVVTYRNNAPVRLAELAEVIESVQDNRTANWVGGRDGLVRAIGLGVQKQPGANTTQVVDRVRELLPAIQAQLPEAIRLDVLRDNSQAVRESVHDVKLTLGLAVALVVLVIFLFLRSLTATFIPAVAIPLALFGTFVVMHFWGYTLDNLSLLALTLSVGFVVDDAIVMLENITRHAEAGLPVRQAALKGSREIGFTILSMTLSLVAVFIPLMFMAGIYGRLLHEFAVTITASILVSGLVSLTLTPMLCSRFLKPHPGGSAGHAHAAAAPSGGFHALSERAFGAMLGFYERTLRVAMRHRLLTFGGAVLTVGLTVWVGAALPKGFIPTDDTGFISVRTEAAQDVSFEEMGRHQMVAAEIIAAHPAVERLMSTIGGGGPGGGAGNSGRFFVRLKPRSERAPASTVVAELRRQLADIPGLRAIPQIPPALNLPGTGGARALYQVTLTADDLDTLYDNAASFERKMRELPALADVTSDLQITSPQLRVDIRRDQAAALGITPAEIEDALYSAFGTRQVSTILTPANQYFVIMELAPEFQRDPAALSLLHVRTRNGRLVPLDAVAGVSRDVGPLTVAHFGQLPAVTVSFNLKPGFALGDATDAIKALARTELPANVGYAFVGSAQAFDQSMQGMLLLVGLALIVVYIVLGVLYEDFVHPLTILSGVPAAGFGALVTLWLFGEELNIMGYVGVILLIGIVKKNAIMMIDFAVDAERERGAAFSPEQAIVEACLVRFRPIMMTTFAALAGALPIALGLGAGAESRRPLGLAVVGGLVVSQLLTLYITPALYVLFSRLTTRHARLDAEEPASDALRVAK